MTQPSPSSPLAELLTELNARDAFAVLGDTYDIGDEWSNGAQRAYDGYWRHVAGVGAGETPLGNISDEFAGLDGALFPIHGNSDLKNIHEPRVVESHPSNTRQDMLGGYSAVEAIAMPLINVVTHESNGSKKSAGVLIGYLVMGNQNERLTLPRDENQKIDYEALRELTGTYLVGNYLAAAAEGNQPDRIQSRLSDMGLVRLKPKVELFLEELEPSTWPVPTAERLKTTAEVLRKATAKHSYDNSAADFAIVIEKQENAEISVAPGVNAEEMKTIITSMVPQLQKELSGEIAIHLNETALNKLVEIGPGRRLREGEATPFFDFRMVDGHALLAARLDGPGNLEEGYAILGNTTNKRGFSASEISLTEGVARHLASRVKNGATGLDYDRERTQLAAQKHVEQGSPLTLIALEVPSLKSEYGHIKDEQKFVAYAQKVDELARRHGGYALHNGSAYDQHLITYFPGDVEKDVTEHSELFLQEVTANLRTSDNKPAVIAAKETATSPEELADARENIEAELRARAKKVWKAERRTNSRERWRTRLRKLLPFNASSASGTMTAGTLVVKELPPMPTTNPTVGHQAGPGQSQQPRKK